MAVNKLIGMVLRCQYKEGLKMENHFEDELVQRYVPIWLYGQLDMKNEVTKLTRIDWLGIQ